MIGRNNRLDTILLELRSLKTVPTNLDRPSTTVASMHRLTMLS